MDGQDRGLAEVRRVLERMVAAVGASQFQSSEFLEQTTAAVRKASPGKRLQASYLLGLIHWFRYQMQPGGEDQADLEAAARHLYPVYQLEPQSVPEELYGLFDQGVTRPDGGAAAAQAYSGAVEMFRLYELGGHLPILLQAVDFLRDACQATLAGHPEHATYLTGLSVTLRELSDRTQDLAALTEAVEVGRLAAEITPGGHADRARHLSNLGAALQSLAERTGNTAMLAEAVDVGRQAVGATAEDHPERAGYLNNLGIALQLMFGRVGDVALLVEAVDAGRAAVRATPVDDPTRARWLSNLGNALRLMFGRTGDNAWLLESVDVGRQAVRVTPEDHPERSARLHNLGNALWALFERLGDLALLTEAVDVLRTAVRDMPEDYANRPGCLSSLGVALRMLFDRVGDTAVLVEAVDAGRAAVRASPEDHPDHPGHLGNLQNALRYLFDRTGDPGLLVEAVDVGYRAVQATPEDHPDRPGCLSNYANTLGTLYKHSGDTKWLAEAVDVGRQSVETAAENHPDRPGCLSDLGAALWMLFEATGGTALLLEAADVGRQAVRARPEDHPEHAGSLINLGNTLRALAEHTADTAALAEALDGYRSASRNAAAGAFVRVQALRQLAVLAASGGGDGVGEAGEALAAVESAVALLRQISPRTLARADREHQIGRLSSIPEVAAVTALNAGDPHRAVELLEATRGMLVADAVDARGGEVARLRGMHPDLAREFEALRDRRDALDLAAAGPDRANLVALAQAAWDELVGRIREEDGFSGFPAATGVAELAVQARQGPVVFLTVGAARCDALIVTADAADPVRTVGLPTTHREVNTRVNQLLKARPTTADRDMEPEAGPTDQRELLEILAWLWDAVAEPVLAALGHTAPPADGEAWPRIWWCPVGEMGYLPLQAAGHHRDLVDADAAVRSAPRTVLDRVVSSYTPTVRALAYARSHRPIAADATLVVAVPDAPDTARLPGVAAEADAIRTLIPSATRPDHPTRAEVLAALPSHPVVHLACHGLADWNDPGASRLVLHDHRTSPLTVADVTALHLTGGLAYLSACSTSSTSRRLADEAVHLTGAFHLAGYQNVIGTLWPVNDHAATRIATDFYARITQDGTASPDTAASAVALHHAIRALRAELPGSPAHWAAHTHTGV